MTACREEEAAPRQRNAEGSVFLGGTEMLIVLHGPPIHRAQGAVSCLASPLHLTSPRCPFR